MTELATIQDLVRGLDARGTHTAVLALHDGGTRAIAYAELGAQALRLARGLADAGIAPGAPVILFGPNSIDWIVVRLALGAMGAVAVALDDLTTDAELAVLVPDSGASHLFVAAAHVARVAALAGADGRRVFALDEPREGAPHWTSLLAGAPGPLPEVRPEHDAMLVFTSGTTGTPKSFLLTHANIMANVRGLLAEALVGPHDRVLLPLPLHHVYPLAVGCLTALASGTTIVLPHGVTGPEMVRALQAGRVSVIVGVPRLYAALLAGIEARVAARGAAAARAFRAMLGASVWVRKRTGARLGKRLFAGLHRQLAPELWLLASGGAKFEAELIWRLEGLGWEVLSGYGLAETASILTANRRGRARIGTEGPPLPGAQLRIAAPDMAGVGEIETRGASVFRGYRGAPEANAEAFTADGWFRTGDLGHLDRDGFVTIAGRVKEMIVLGGGKNVFPEEVEKVYAGSPYIREVAVLERNGALVALVVPDFDAIAATASRRVEDIVRVALAERAQTLASYQRLAGFAITREPLPRTRLGKYQRFRLREIYERAKAGAAAAGPAPLSPEDRALLAEPRAAEIWAWLQARYPDKALSPELSPQLDLGIDSLEWVTLTLELAERFGVQLTEADASTTVTLRDLLRRALDRAGTPGAAAAPARVELTAAQRQWLAPRGPGARLGGGALYALNAALMRALFRLDVAGLENVPRAGAYVIVCNHLSDLDPLIVAAALDAGRRANIRWSGDAGRIFAGAAGRALARAAQIFPVDERAPATTLAYAEAVLRAGHALVWFPESWRSPDGALQPFLPGIGHLLRRLPVPVVPARIFGTFEAMPRTARWPRPHKVRIVFGAPIDDRALAAAHTGEGAPARIAAALHDAVAALGRSGA